MSVVVGVGEVGEVETYWRRSFWAAMLPEE